MKIISSHNNGYHLSVLGVQIIEVIRARILARQDYKVEDR